MLYFIDSYERTRFPIECFMEALPLSALQVSAPTGLMGSCTHHACARCLPNLETLASGTMFVDNMPPATCCLRRPTPDAGCLLQAYLYYLARKDTTGKLQVSTSTLLASLVGSVANATKCIVMFILAANSAHTTYWG
jgi:hypothetical protein